MFVTPSHEVFGNLVYFEGINVFILTNWCRLNGMVDCGDRHKHIYERAMLLVEQVKESKGSPLLTCLLEGPSGRYVSVVSTS